MRQQYTISEIYIFVGLLIVFGLMLAFFPLGCAKTPQTPQTHEEWANYCIEKNDSEFVDCLKRWDEWKK